MVEYRSGGRRVSQQEFFRNMQKKAIDIALNALADRVHGVASAIVDPATGKHADTFVRRHGTAINGLSAGRKVSPAVSWPTR